MPSPRSELAVWSWESRHNAFPATGPLWLSPVLWSQELFEECEDPAEAVHDYLTMIKTDFPMAREVPLSWQVANFGERAPFQQHDGDVDGMRIINGSFAGDDFLHYFTWPESPTTGERVDWYRLPVRPERGAQMWEAFDWLPLPLQRTVSVDVLGLLVRRARSTTASVPEPRATEKQVTYLASLLRKTGDQVDPEVLAALSKSEARQRISALVDQRQP
ncbi:hypothetical protein [Streptomyces benahoarensis]|uniref:Uncharacterized protein n=1 Tax=Streptomyces benahoarensis TaxID=2595054 RepID=A0A553ZIQ6_9ACTN|nr:hypothetical protein [Streptomyces benahoarensis]TSB31882.1 hypothetical protein FNJ62_04260 [Streptomyces benahoarensis]TSB41329.1 hypothetical protein FNZ23_12720 [Streptomyces benahoarensis]